MLQQAGQPHALAVDLRGQSVNMVPYAGERAMTAANDRVSTNSPAREGMAQGVHSNTHALGPHACTHVLHACLALRIPGFGVFTHVIEAYSAWYVCK